MDSFYKIEDNLTKAQDSATKARRLMNDFVEEFETGCNAPSVKSMTLVPTFDPDCYNPESETNRTLTWVVSYRAIMTRMQIVFDYINKIDDELWKADETARELIKQIPQG